MRASDGDLIRVLKVVPTLLCGGTETQFMALARSLDVTRFAVEFACLRRLGPFVGELQARRIPLHDYPLSSFCSLGAVRQQVRVARRIARNRIDIVHTYNFYGNVFAAAPARLAGAPVVIASIRDRGPYLTAMQRRVQRRVCHFADRILVNAEAVRDWLVDDGYDASRIVVVPNGVDLARFETADNAEAAHAALGVPSGVPLVGVVSRLTRLKGLEPFLASAAQIARRFPTVRFAIVGEPAIHDGVYLDELRGLAGRLGIADRVIFAGLRHDVPALLAGFSVSVMPSLNEALSNVVLESMAAGAPTVATRVGGTPEALQDGVTGLLVPPDDVPALVEAVTRVLNAPALGAALGRAARAHIRDRFSMERMVDATEHLYLDLLARASRRRVPASWPSRHYSPPLR